MTPRTKQAPLAFGIRGAPKPYRRRAGRLHAAISGCAARALGPLRRTHDARRLGPYILEERIGVGGMGEVWRAWHTVLGRTAAVKLLLGPVGSTTAATFEREVQAATQLTHANTVDLYDHGVSDDGRFFYGMELLEGLTLQALVQRAGPLPPARVVHLLTQILAALGEAHERGLVHRDVTPANVMVTRRGADRDFIKLLDFGLARQGGASTDTELPSPDAIQGTPAYMAPESILNDAPPDGRTDLYAVGALGYLLLSGAPPFTGPTATRIMMAHLLSRPRPLSRVCEHEVPADLEAVILRALEKRAEHRFATARDMADALRACVCGAAWTRADAASWWAEDEASRPDQSLDSDQTNSANDITYLNILQIRS